VVWYRSVVARQRGVDARDEAVGDRHARNSDARSLSRQALTRSNTEYVREDLIANAFMRLGDRESAVQWMVKGVASNVGGIEFSLADSLYAPIRSDPRIEAPIVRLRVR
jgi:hypothetical protein